MLICERFPTFDNFLNYVKIERPVLNFNNDIIIKNLKKVYKDNINNKFTKDNIRIYVTEGLNLKTTTHFSQNFWLERGYDKLTAQLKISTIQSNIGKKCNINGKLNLRFTKEWFKIRHPDNWEEKYNLKHKKTSPSLENHIRRYGEDRGLIEYEKNSKNRAITKQKMITKYGEIDGLKRWNQYRYKQWYTNTPEYFIEKHGEILGLKKWLDAFGNVSSRSKISKKLFDGIIQKFNISLDECYYYDNEWNIFLNQTERDIINRMVIRPDFKYNNKIIEFYGDNIHGNPIKYVETDILPYKNLKITAGEKWNNDRLRENIIKNRGFDLLVVWEYDYRKNPTYIQNMCGIFLKD